VVRTPGRCRAFGHEFLARKRAGQRDDRDYHCDAPKEHVKSKRCYSAGSDCSYCRFDALKLTAAGANVDGFSFAGLSQANDSPESRRINSHQARPSVHEHQFVNWVGYKSGQIPIFGQDEMARTHSIS
jgi:hypothetical protein